MLTKERISIGLLQAEHSFRTELELALAGYGFDVKFSAATFDEFWHRLSTCSVDVVLLDTGRAGGEVVSAAARLRASHSTGIILMSDLTSLEDRLRGLESGADIYITKPVDLLELSSVVRSLARRMCLSAKNDSELDRNSKPETASDSIWSLQDGGWRLVDPSGLSLALSAHERTFLEALLNASGNVVTRERLTEMIVPEVVSPNDLRRIDVLVSRLRSKARVQGIRLPILSVRGKGFVFTR